MKWWSTDDDDDDDDDVLSEDWIFDGLVDDDDVVPNLRSPCDGVVDVCIELRLHFLSLVNVDKDVINFELELLQAFEFELAVFNCCFNLISSCWRFAFSFLINQSNCLKLWFKFKMKVKN